MDKHKIIADFLQNEPLYSKVEIDKHFFHPLRFYGQTFKFYCPNEKSMQTFKLVLEPEEIMKRTDGRLDNRDTLNFYQEDNNIKFNVHYSGACQFCKKFKVDFLINVFSDGPIPGLSIVPSFQIVGGEVKSNSPKLPEHKLFIRKIGQYPPFEVKPEKEIINFFQDGDKEYYKKALICLSQSFGVGAYAYLRRVTENEILRIVRSLCEIQTQDGEKIKSLYEAYKINKQMNALIEGIYPYLPASLKAIGNNPLKVLHSHFSEGIHNYSEETCLKKAFNLNTILIFTIKKINEEKYELKGIRDALKNLDQ